MGSCVPPARDQHAATAQARAALEPRADGAHDVPGLGQATDADLAVGEEPLARRDHLDASRAQGPQIVRRRRVQVHPGVHRRGDHHRPVEGQVDASEQPVAEPRRHPGERVRRRGGDQQEIGPSGELEVVVPGALVGAEELRPDGPARERREGRGADEAPRRVRHDHRDAVALAHQAPEHVDRLVRGDPAAHAEDDLSHRCPLALPRPGARSPRARPARARRSPRRGPR